MPGDDGIIKKWTYWKEDPYVAEGAALRMDYGTSHGTFERLRERFVLDL